MSSDSSFQCRILSFDKCFIHVSRLANTQKTRALCIKTHERHSHIHFTVKIIVQGTFHAIALVDSYYINAETGNRVYYYEILGTYVGSGA